MNSGQWFLVAPREEGQSALLARPEDNWREAAHAPIRPRGRPLLGTASLICKREHFLGRFPFQWPSCQPEGSPTSAGFLCKWQPWEAETSDLRNILRQPLERRHESTLFP